MCVRSHDTYQHANIVLLYVCQRRSHVPEVTSPYLRDTQNIVSAPNFSCVYLDTL